MDISCFAQTQEMENNDEVRVQTVAERLGFWRHHITRQKRVV